VNLGRRRASTRRAVLHRPALTASAEQVNRKSASELVRLNQGWQAAALGFYDTLGECHYPAQFYSRSFQMIDVFPAVLDEEGNPQQSEDPLLVDLWEQVQDPGGGGIGELKGSYGRLMWLVGDGRLTVTLGEDGEEQWEFLSPLELRILPDGAGFQRFPAPGLDPVTYREAPDGQTLSEGEARVWRLWRKHPTYSQWADSPVRAVIDLYQLLTMLTLAANAQSQSRAANRGAIFMPEEFDFGPQDTDAGDEDPETDPFIEEFTSGLVTAIKDPGSASAMAPLIIRAKALIENEGHTSASAAKDLMGWIPLGPDNQYTEAEMWEKTIKRIAVGLDWPVELMTGVGQLNHWSGWLVDEQAFRQHQGPAMQKFCDDMAAAYLRPAARAAGFADWQNVVLDFDPSKAIVHSDETKTARDAFNDGAVSSVYYREKIGANDQDAPSEDDIALLLALRGRTAAQEFGPEAVAGEGQTGPNDGGTGADVNEDVPESNGNPVDAVTASALRAARIMGAAELYVERARTLAGSRLISRSKGCADCRTAIENVRPALVASALGSETVRDVINGHTSEAALVSGAGDELAAALARWVGGDWPREIGKLMENHALRTLYEPEPPALPTGFAAVVAKAVA
jgi:hypothetical protein